MSCKKFLQVNLVRSSVLFIVVCTLWVKCVHVQCRTGLSSSCVLYLIVLGNSGSQFCIVEEIIEKSEGGVHAKHKSTCCHVAIQRLVSGVCSETSSFRVQFSQISQPLNVLPSSRKCMPEKFA